MIAYIVKRDIKARVKYLTYEENHGVIGAFIDENGTTDINDIYDILIIDGYHSRLIEGCHNTQAENGHYLFKGIRAKDL